MCLNRRLSDELQQEFFSSDNYFIKMILRITLLMFIVTFYVSGVNVQSKGIFSKGTKIVMPNIQGYFKECGVSGTIAIYDIRNDIWFVSDTSDSKIESVPAIYV